MNPRVSVIVPIYNVESYIERCAVSLFEQTYDSIEYVFVNDCTPDQSINVLEHVLGRYPQRSSQTKVINHDRNRGVAASRNTALDNCAGEFVIQVDPDDYIELGAIESLIKRQEQDDSDIVTGQMLRHDIDQVVPLHFPKYAKKEEMVVDMMQTTIMHSLANRLIKRSLFEDYHIRAKEGVNCGEDCWMMTRLAYYAKSVDTIDEVVYHYDCTRDNSYTSDRKGTINKKKIQDDIATANMIIDFFKDKEQIYYDEANRVAIRYAEFVMKKAANASDSELYNKMLTYLRSFDKKYWDAIGWNKTCKRAIYQNFCSLRTALFLSRVYYKILSYKYK